MKRLICIILLLGFSASISFANIFEDTADWFENAANDVGDWVEVAANDTVDWTVGAAEDTANWTVGAAEDTANWTVGAAEDTANWTVGSANWSVGQIEEGIDYVEIGGAYAETFFQALCEETSYICGVTTNSTDFEYLRSWPVRALTLQNRLDKNVPIKFASFPYTHNSYNSKAYRSPVRYLFPNHNLSILNQLNTGIRALELDLHWALNGVTNLRYETVLCHDNSDNSTFCSIEDREFEEGLEEVKQWFAVSDNKENEVIIIYLEYHLGNDFNDAINQINKEIGDLVYKPKRNCDKLPINISKQDVLSLGKNIILVGAKDDTCNTEWGRYVHKGDFSGGVSYKGFVGYPTCQSNGLEVDLQSGVYREWNSATPDGRLKGMMTVEDVQKMSKCGVAAIGPEPLDWRDPRTAAQIWSWDKEQPDNAGGHEDCSEHLPGGRFNDANCGNIKRFACQNTETRGWEITNSSGPWRLGRKACADQYGADGFIFSVPANGYENEKLSEKKRAIAADTVWLNYSDFGREGDWVAFEEQYFQMKALGKCLSSEHVLPQDGAKAWLWDCGNEIPPAWQKWSHDADGRIHSGANYGLCLEVDARDSDGARVSLEGCNTNENQKWVRSGNTIRSQANGRVLNVHGADKSNGALVNVWTENGNVSQEWKLMKKSKYVSFNNQGKCITVENSDIKNGNNVGIHECSGSDAQRWIYDNKERLHSALDYGKCLNIEAANTADWANVQVWDCHEGANQKWYREGLSIRSRMNNKDISIVKSNVHMYKHGVNRSLQSWQALDSVEL